MTTAKQDGKNTETPHHPIIGGESSPIFIPPTRPTRAAQPSQASGDPSSAIHDQA